MHIGVLEDDIEMQQLYQVWLESIDYECDCYDTVKGFLDVLQQRSFDLLLIDWVLPDGSGEEALHWIRAHKGWDVPVIFITSRDSEADIVTALKSGADDYIVKPAKFYEVLARIEAQLRRCKPHSVRTYGAYQVDQQQHSIRLRGQPIQLTQKEYELACFLFENPGKLLSRVQLMEKVWGLSPQSDARNVDMHIVRLRQKLDLAPANGWHVVPVYGWGYRIEKTTV